MITTTNALRHPTHYVIWRGEIASAVCKIGPKLSAMREASSAGALVKLIRRLSTEGYCGLLFEAEDLPQGGIILVPCRRSTRRATTPAPALVASPQLDLFGGARE